ncbi:MAG: adenylate/guanylate cyclase domain-containing protein [Chloroflexota bacterium]
MLAWFSPQHHLEAFDRLRKYNVSEKEVAQLKEYAGSSDDRALFRINPRYLAKWLNWSDGRTLDVLVWSVLENLWRLEWDSWCPGCGALLHSTPDLGKVEAHQRCPACSWEGDILLDQVVTIYVSLDASVRKLHTARQDDPIFRKVVDTELGQMPALRLINRPVFREALGDRVLPHNQSLGIQHLAVFFSDLKSSTALYQRLGDAEAYQLVRQHFLSIFEAVETHGGAAVKTIGDGIMGTFLGNSAALLGIVESMQAIAELNQMAGLRGQDRLRLKVGLHAGPCIVVTLNHRLDYFGSTVNIASRVSHMSEGDDLLLSEAVLQDPEAARIVHGLGKSDVLTVTLRGISKPMALHRIRFNLI